MTSNTWRERDIKGVERFVAALMLLHTLMAYYHFSTTSNPDNVYGLFLYMGAGAHVAGAVALSAGIYYLFHPISRSPIGRWGFPLFVSSVPIISDAKQVLLVFGLSLGLLSLFSMRHAVLLKFRQVIQTARFVVIPIIGVGFVSYFAVPQNMIDRFLRDGEAGIELKLTVFTIIRSYHDSLANMFLGLGPGHTISRLGWMFPVYKDLMTSLGGTNTQVTAVILYEDIRNYLSNGTTGSSLFSLSFSWAGIWGDIGVIGVAVYLFTWILIWRRFCVDQLSKFFVLNVLLFGLIFEWLEEPAYVGFIAILIGIRWQALQERPQHT